MKKTLSSAALAAILGIAAATSAVAQHNEYGYWFSRTAPFQPTCPTIEWNVIPVVTLPAIVNGVAYFSDMSGVSQIKGNVAADGTISATLTSVYGNGPAGTVTGTHAKAGTHFVLKGAGCSNTSFNMMKYNQNTAAGGF